MGQVHNTFLVVDRDPCTVHSQYNDCFWPGDTRSHYISSHEINIIFHGQIILFAAPVIIIHIETTASCKMCTFQRSFSGLIYHMRYVDFWQEMVVCVSDSYQPILDLLPWTYFVSNWHSHPSITYKCVSGFETGCPCRFWCRGCFNLHLA